MIVVHNVDQRSSTLYDIKLAEYAQPICVENLDVDLSLAADSYHSDKIFNEEIEKNEEEEEKKADVDFNVNFQYQGEDENPVQVGIDVPE